MKPLVIYHSACPDGFTAAWVAARALGDVELFEGRYGEEPPFELAKGRRVYIVDFSYKREKLEALHAVCAQLPDGNELTVLDHHKTAQAELEGLPYCTFDMDRSGAGLTWDHFHPGEPRPWIVDYVEDRDLWRFRMPDSHALAIFIQSARYGLDEWDLMAQLDVNDVRKTAYGCMRYLDHYCQKALQQSYQMRVHYESCPSEPGGPSPDGLQYEDAICVNAQYLGISELLNEALTRGTRLALGWYLDGRDGQIVVSLRSVSGMDCSEIARYYGGGGHAQASGFRIPIDHPLARELMTTGASRYAVAQAD